MCRRRSQERLTDSHVGSGACRTRDRGSWQTRQINAPAREGLHPYVWSLGAQPRPLALVTALFWGRQGPFLQKLVTHVSN